MPGHRPWPKHRVPHIPWRWSNFAPGTNIWFNWSGMDRSASDWQMVDTQAYRAAVHQSVVTDGREGQLSKTVNFHHRPSTIQPSIIGCPLAKPIRTSTSSNDLLRIERVRSTSLGLHPCIVLINTVPLVLTRPDQADRCLRSWRNASATHSRNKTSSQGLVTNLNTAPALMASTMVCESGWPVSRMRVVSG